jgi:chromosomal replication initiator protein
VAIVRTSKNGRRLAQQHDLDRTWANIQTSLRTAFPDSTYQIWLAALRPVALDEAALYLQAPDATCDWVRRRFGPALRKAAAEVDPSIRRVELLEVDVAEHSEPKPPSQENAVPDARAVAAAFKHAYTFNRFVIGRTNHFAHAAALAAAEMPGHAYNPLLIYGPPGVGKTHLLQSIGNYVATHDTNLSVHYTTVEGFTGDFTSALKHGKLERFKSIYRSYDVLLLDDLQFLQGKRKTTEELFHTFDSLMGSGAQVVISSDVHPSRAPFLEARFKERLEAGLTIDLQPPDHETRLAIIRKLVKSNEVQISNGALEHLAQHASSNIRALEGTFIRIVAFASLSESEITVELIDRVLTSLYRTTPPTSDLFKPTAAQIQHETATALGLGTEDLFSPGRSRPVVYARQIAMYLCRELGGFSFPEIARHFRRRDHTTALHAHRKMKAQLLTDHATRSLVTSITDTLHTRTHTDQHNTST